MPMLVTGPPVITIPPPGVEDFGVGSVQGGGGVPYAGVIHVQSENAATGIHGGQPIELRMPGIEDRPAVHPAWAFDRRTDTADADNFYNPGTHVVQTPGHAEGYGFAPPMDPVFPSTWRLEPVPADTGQYLGGG